MTIQIGDPTGKSDLEAIRILHVDDEAEVAELSASYLKRDDERFEVTVETSIDDAMERLASADLDCVISDYEMPEMTGLEFLDAVRSEYPALPFILFTGKGSEEIASEAISAGVTDYLQKGTSVDQYTVLANRIRNAVSQYRAEQEIEATQRRFRKLVEHSTDVISVVDAEGRWQYLTPSSERILGYEPDELVGEVGFDYVHPEDRPQAIEHFTDAIENPDGVPSVEFRYDHPEKGWVWLENHARNMVEDPVIEGFVVHTREITERKARAEELRRQNERLDEFASIVSHDLRSPLSVAKGHLELVQADHDIDRLDDVAAAHERLETIIDRTLTLATSGEAVGDLEPIPLQSVVESSWRNVDTRNATLSFGELGTVTADSDRLSALFENLFRNAVDHCGDNVSVSVGRTPEGFYVADDGPGIPAGDREAVFEQGVTTSENGFGLGLATCKRIAEAHGWEIRILESEHGGTRVELTTDLNR